MVKTKVNAGVCGFTTEIEASAEDFQHVSFNIKTDCKNIEELAKNIPVVDAYHEIRQGFDGEILTLTRKMQKSNCAGCAVPCAIFKSMQAAANLALPKNVSIEISK